MAKLEIEESCKGEITVQCWDKNEIVVEGQEIYIENGKELINDYMNTDILPHISQYTEDEITPYVSAVKELAATAAESATKAETAAGNAQIYSQNSEGYAAAAKTSAEEAAASATAAENSATEAKNSTTAAATSETNASTYADEAKSWATGDIDERTEGSAKYWAEQAETSVASANVTEISILTETSGTFTPETNKIYSAAIDGDTVFSLPETVDTGVFNQIKVMLKVTGNPAVTWGTEFFFNKESPALEEGNYDVYFDYDNNLGDWVAGVLAKGAVS